MFSSAQKMKDNTTEAIVRRTGYRWLYMSTKHETTATDIQMHRPPWSIVKRDTKSVVSSSQKQVIESRDPTHAAYRSVPQQLEVQRYWYWYWYCRPIHSIHSIRFDIRQNGTKKVTDAVVEDLTQVNFFQSPTMHTHGRWNRYSSSTINIRFEWPGLFKNHPTMAAETYSYSPTKVRKAKNDSW